MVLSGVTGIDLSRGINDATEDLKCRIFEYTLVSVGIFQIEYQWRGNILDSKYSQYCNIYFDPNFQVQRRPLKSAATLAWAWAVGQGE